jgi:hypothetical protein
LYGCGIDPSMTGSRERTRASMLGMERSKARV